MDIKTHKDTASLEQVRCSYVYRRSKTHRISRRGPEIVVMSNGYVCTYHRHTSQHSPPPPPLANWGLCQVQCITGNKTSTDQNLRTVESDKECGYDKIGYCHTKAGRLQFGRSHAGVSNSNKLKYENFRQTHQFIIKDGYMFRPYTVIIRL